MNISLILKNEVPNELIKDIKFTHKKYIRVFSSLFTPLRSSCEPSYCFEILLIFGTSFVSFCVPSSWLVACFFRPGFVFGLSRTLLSKPYPLFFFFHSPIPLGGRPCRSQTLPSTRNPASPPKVFQPCRRHPRSTRRLELTAQRCLALGICLPSGKYDLTWGFSAGDGIVQRSFNVSEGEF